MLSTIRYPNYVSELIFFVFCSWIINEFEILLSLIDCLRRPYHEPVRNLELKKCVLWYGYIEKTKQMTWD